ncbi:MAG TPA: DUF4245 domain-containing protein [Actinocrinis sp.]|nr:DUF4245 domain-containing protein [Actinocrinis sp.]
MAKSQSRLRQSARDMVFSLGVIAVPIAVVMVLLPTSGPASPVSSISPADFQGTLAAARAGEPFPVLAPTSVPAGWQLTSANYTEPGASAADWHIGYYISASSFAEVEQTTEKIGEFLQDQKADAQQVANVQINGVTWQEYTGTTPTALQTVLVRTATGSVTDLVAGSAPLAQLEQLAGSLQR